jgi:F-type H+-transporting ATPase subunit epsilon
MADSNLFTVNLVTPERILLEGAASEVILRSGVGDITILAGHTPLVGSVEPGVIRVVREDGQVERVAAHGGFIQVEQHVEPEAGDGGPAGSSGTRVTLLVGVAELAEEIDASRAQVALDAAEARVAELTGSGGRATGGGDDDEPDAELTEAESSLRRAQVRLEALDVTSASAA